MKHLKRILLFLGLIAFTFSSCKKKGDVTAKEQEEQNETNDGKPSYSELEQEVKNILPEVAVDDLKEKEMKIYTGTTPPTIEGVYLVAPFKLTVPYGTDDGFKVGQVVVDYAYKFYTQNNLDINVNSYSLSSTSKSEGSGAVITGKGNKFTVFSEQKGISNGVNNTEVIVLSGEMTKNGIKNLQYAFMLTEKDEPDPEKPKLMPINRSRIYEDGDSLSIPYNPEKLKAYTGDNTYLNSEITYQSVSDIDGNTYPVVKIGEQYWMAENLRTTKYNDGTPIPLVSNSEDWKNTDKGAYAYYDNDESNGALYGKIYNGHTVITKKLCPVGWRVPYGSEWSTLVNYVSNLGSLGGYPSIKMMAGYNDKREMLWETTASTPNNESGLTLQPGSGRGDKGEYESLGRAGVWWFFLSDNSSGRAGFRAVSSKATQNINNNPSLNFGVSCRCIKDVDID